MEDGKIVELFWQRDQQALEEGEAGPGSFSSFPDIIMMDGGKGRTLRRITESSLATGRSSIEATISTGL